MEKILLFTSRQMCYHSAAFFMSMIKNCLEELGFVCEVCELDESEIPGKNSMFAEKISDQDEIILGKETELKLEKVLNNKYLFILDFNSKLPRLVLDDGSYYLDHIDAPFYNYILDNPLYHHSSLECSLKNYNLILPDRNHCDYVKKYYKNIKNVIHIPLGAREAKEKTEFIKKEKNILFMGTYRNPDIYLDYIKKCDKEHCDNMLKMIEILKYDGNVIMETALLHVLKEKDIILEKNEFKLLMNYYYPVEMYLRNYYREKVVKELIREGFPVKIVGDWWEESDISKNADLKNGVKFEESYDIIAKSEILLDSSPFFKAGVHDRVIAGFANKTAVLTDENIYIKEKFEKQQVLITYNNENLKTLCESANYLLENTDVRNEMVQRAYEEYRKNFTWNKITEKILNHSNR